MDLTNKRIAITGATGFLGTHLARACRAAGAEVIGVVRSPEKGAHLEADGVTFRKADLADRVALTEAFDGVDAVISNAALFRMSQMSRRFERENTTANITGTDNVYKAIAEAGVKRVIQISTVGVYRWSLNARLREDSPQLDGKRMKGGAYRGSKQVSEEKAWAYAAEHDLQLTAIRPSGIYGARDTNVMQTARRMISIGRWTQLFPAPLITFPLVYAGDVANAVVAALRNEASIGEAYNTCGSDDSILRFLTAWKRVTGQIRPLLLPMPTWFPIPIKLGVFVDSSKAARDLGFANRPFEEGLRETLEMDPTAFGR